MGGNQREKKRVVAIVIWTLVSVIVLVEAFNLAGFMEWNGTVAVLILVGVVLPAHFALTNRWFLPRLDRWLSNV